MSTRKINKPKKVKDLTVEEFDRHITKIIDTIKEVDSNRADADRRRRMMHSGW